MKVHGYLPNAKPDHSFHIVERSQMLSRDIESIQPGKTDALRGVTRSNSAPKRPTKWASHMIKSTLSGFTGVR
ncbi:MAG TPA: hypothetical protein VMJ93_17205 [Verrucomicrobiae bacterium]|nr:hypothetical protein [Verrucomicrobiae bacterium]